MEHKGTVQIETQRLILRRFKMDDAEAAYANWESDKKVTKFLTWKNPANIQEVRQMLGEWIEHYDDPSFYQWAIILKVINQPIGSISVVEQDERIQKVHIGYCIGSRWWNCGYTSEALAGVIPFFFEEVRAQRIESRHDPNNPNSGKVMMKCGLQYEGTLRKADWNNQGIVDASVYGLLAEDYFADVSISRHGRRHMFDAP